MTSPTDKIALFIRASVPAKDANALLRHIRNFDTTHAECHFEVLGDFPDIAVSEMLEMIRVDPALTFQTIIERAKKE